MQHFAAKPLQPSKFYLLQGVLSQKAKGLLLTPLLPKEPGKITPSPPQSHLSLEVVD